MLQVFETYPPCRNWVRDLSSHLSLYEAGLVVLSLTTALQELIIKRNDINLCKWPWPVYCIRWGRMPNWELFWILLVSHTLRPVSSCWQDCRAFKMITAINAKIGPWARGSVHGEVKKNMSFEGCLKLWPWKTVISTLKNISWSWKPRENREIFFSQLLGW